MPTSIPQSTLEKFTTFGDLLRFLRRHAGITQLELSIAVGYSTAQICRLEQNLRLPDPPTIEARFVPALYLEDEPKAVARLMELAATVRREDAPEPGMSPFKGLEYFDEADAGLFVGREALSAKLAERVLSLTSRKAQKDKRFFAIVGASGSGKSSLARAGLVPALRWDKRSANWQIHVFTPSAHPLESLASTLSQENGSVASITAMMDDLRRDERSLGLHIKRDLKTTNAPQLLLVIDQFEELFTLCHSEEERSAFIDNLITASSDDDGQAIVIITLRADFYAHCASYPQLRQALARQQEYIGVMSDEEMRRAIEEPARRGHWEFEPGLVDLILHDVGHEPGALPLLSHALLETWQRRHGRTLTLSGYTSAGGVRGAIAETAESVFTDQFTHEQQAIARRIFLRLTELGDETATGDTRRRASFSELILKPEETDATQAVLNALVEARLITTSEDSVQVAHEALIREWPTLRGWLEDNREGLRLHRQLTEAAQDWQSVEREPDMLFRGARLAQAREWAAAHGDDLNVLEREFLEASVAAGEREAAERETQRQRELEAAQKLAEVERRRAEEEGLSARKLRRRAIYLGMALGITFVLVVVAIVFARQASQNAVFAGNQRSTAEAASVRAINEANIRATAEGRAVIQQSLAEAASTQSINEANIRATAEANAVAAAEINQSLSLAGAAQLANQAGQGDLALALAMEAVKMDQPPPEARAALRSIAVGPGTRLILNKHSNWVRSIAISQDDHLALSGSCSDSTVVEENPCPLGELALWDLDAGKKLRIWTAHAGWVTAVAISPDSQLLISGGTDGEVILWDANSGSELRRLQRQSGGIISMGIISTSLARESALLTGSSDGAMILWDINTGAILKQYVANAVPLTNLAFASKSPRAVAGYADGSLILWDLNSAQPIWQTKPSEDFWTGITISADGNSILYTASMSLRKIDSQSGEVVKELHNLCDMLPTLVSPDGEFALIRCGNSVIRWDVIHWREQEELSGGWEEARGLSFSQDGRLGIYGYTDGSLRLWNLVDALNYQAFQTGLSFPDALAVSPNGQSILLGNSEINSQTPVLWDITTAKIVKTFKGFNGMNSPNTIGFSPDGRYAAAGGGNFFGVTSLVVWDLESGAIYCQIDGYQSVVRSLAFSPDSRFLLASSMGMINELILWDVQSCQLVRRFDLNKSEDATGIAFSSDGRLVATGSPWLQRTVLWDVASGQEIRRFPHQDSSIAFPIMDLAFGPDNRTILAPGPESLELWDIETGMIIRRYSGQTAFVDSVDISSDGKDVLASLTNGDVILWDFSTGEELYRLTAHTQPVLSAQFSPDSKYVYSISTDGLLIQWKIPAFQAMPETLDWINTNRYIRSLTCDERLHYRVQPLCRQESP